MSSAGRFNDEPGPDGPGDTASPDPTSSVQPNASAAPPDAATASTGEEAAQPKRLRPRFGMLTLMLFAGVVCVWSMYFQLLRVNPELEEQIESMRAISRELVLEDPNLISIVKHLESWYDEAIWTVYIPEGQTFNVILCTRDITESWDPMQDAQVAAEAELSAGTYKVELKQTKTDEGIKVTVLVDDQEFLTKMEEGDKKWDPGQGSSGGANFSSPGQSLKDTVVLYRRRFTQDVGDGSFRTPKGPTNGIELRLRKVAR